MENLPNLLKREISKGLPAIEAHRVMAPLERVLDQNYDEIDRVNYLQNKVEKLNSDIFKLRGQVKELKITACLLPEYRNPKP